MSERDVLRLFPARRVRAYDGMAVTAEVWEAAHEYQRRALELHTHFSHGSGIVFGLEVIAGEPADRQIYVQPGLAIDSLGRTIVLQEQRGYDLRSIDGVVYIVLTFGESQPRSDGSRMSDDAPRFVFAEYSLEALLALPATPHVELARVRRESGGAAIRNADNPELPTANEIDMRHRASTAAPQVVEATMAVVAMGNKVANHVSGALNLARAAQLGGRTRVVVDAFGQIDRSVLGHTMLYLVGNEAFQLTGEQATVLYEYYKQGGVIFYESCRAHGTGEPAGDASFMDLVAAMGVTLRSPAETDPLFQRPHLFAGPPDGFETQGTSRVLIGDGVIFSSFDYGCMWQGKRRGRAAGRSEIRNAMEWGENLLAFALRRGRKP